MQKAHTKLCQCSQCAELRFERFVETLTTFEAKNHILPTNPDQTVCVKSFRVRSHFRRNPHHMNGDPALKERVTAFFKQVTKPVKNGLSANDVPGVRSRLKRRYA